MFLAVLTHLTLLSGFLGSLPAFLLLYKLLGRPGPPSGSSAELHPTFRSVPTCQGNNWGKQQNVFGQRTDESVARLGR